MKNFFVLFLLTLLFSCSGGVDEPKNLIPEDKMAEIIAELSLNDQAMQVNVSANLEEGTRFVLKKHHISGKDFNASYEYYIKKHKIKDILSDAQDILLEKFPSSKPFIEKKKKETEATSGTTR